MKHNLEALSDASRDAIPSKPFPAVVTLVVGLAFSLLLWVEQDHKTEFALESRFVRVCERQSLDLQETLRSHLDSLHSIRSFFYASKEVERNEFDTFVQPLLKIYPFVYAFEWIPKVQSEQVADFVRLAAEDGIQNFALLETSKDGKRIPAGKKPDYFPAYYLSPIQGNEVALGLDYASDPDRYEAMQRSVRMDQIGLTRPLKLLRFADNKNDPYGLVAFIPIYAGGTAPEDQSLRSAHLRGYVAATFHAGQMIDRTLREHRNSGIRWRVEVPNPGGGDSVVLYQYPLAPKVSHRPEKTVFSWSSRMSLGGQRWIVLFEATPEFEAEVRSGKQPIIPLTAVLITVLIALIVYESERRRQQRIAQQMALEDPLTGLLNLRAFDILAEHTVRAALRSGKGFILAIADLDHLKRINDALGHAEGDLAIRKAGRAIRDSIRKSDIAARVGGDEFCVILRETDLKGFETFRKHLTESLRTAAGSPVNQPVGMSLGAVYFDPQDPKTVADLRRIADERLYQNKSRR